MFTCTARHEAADAKAFTTVFPSVPVVGLPCGGEIGPRARSTPGGTQTGDAALQGFTAVYGLFAVPERSRAVPLYFPDIAAAYEECRARPAAVAA
eukprot:368589-Prymnesium_polylepis.1